MPALKSDFLCDVCDFIKLAYFTQCLQKVYVVVKINKLQKNLTV